MVLTKYVRKRRRELDLTQKELGEKTGLSPVSISRIEVRKDDDSLPFATIKLLAQGFDMHPDELIKLAREAG